MYNISRSASLPYRGGVSPCASRTTLLRAGGTINLRRQRLQPISLVFVVFVLLEALSEPDSSLRLFLLVLELELWQIGREDGTMRRC